MIDKDFNFDEFYEFFESKYRGSRESIKDRLRFYRPLLESYIFQKPGSILVDIGCGRGEFLEVCREVGFNVIGVDTSERFVNISKSFGFEVYNEDALSFLNSKRENSFNVISAIHLVEHLEFGDLVKFISVCYDKLKSDGFVIFEFPYIHSYKVISHFFWLDPTHKRPLDPYLLIALMEYIGFKDCYMFFLGQGREEFNQISKIVENGPVDVAIVGFKNKLEDEKLISAINILKSNSQKTFFELINQYDKYIDFTINNIKNNIKENIESLNFRLNDIDIRLSNIENSKLMKFYRKIVDIKNRILKKKSIIKTKEDDLYSLTKIISGRIKQVKKEKDRYNLAYLSPVPPEKSGISFYSQELLPYLAQYYDITVVTDSEPDKSISSKFKVINYDLFFKSLEDFDRVLMHLGNNPIHSKMLEVINKTTVLTVLHDFFLTDLYHLISERFFQAQLYYSHGYTALIELRYKGISYTKSKYPCNRNILNLSCGVIVHSDYIKNFVKDLYPVSNLSKIYKVNFPVLQPENPADFKDNQKFEILTFGFITPLKATDKIVEAFGQSEFLKENAKLIIAGKFLNEDYKQKITTLIDEYGITDKVMITGYLDEDSLKRHIKNADLVVLLRQEWRGETSKTAFDTLALGKPLIVNKFGSFDDIPEDVVYKIEDIKDLRTAMETLIKDKHLRLTLSQRAFEYISKFHNLKSVAFDYYRIIEDAYSKELNFQDSFRQRVLFVDISSLITDDHKTGIQRVMKAQLLNLIKNPPEGFRVEPIYLKKDRKGRWAYFYARRFTSSFLSVENYWEDEEITVSIDDILYIPDYHPLALFEAYRQGYFNSNKPKKIVSLVYDMLPIKFPKFFPEFMEKYHRHYIDVIATISDKVLTISNHVKTDLERYLQESGKSRIPEIDYIYLGSDFKAVPHSQPSEEEKRFIEHIKPKRYFLMVSTIEPRKGFDDILDTFEILWRDGFDYQLVFVGKEGWNMEKFIHRIKHHKLLGNKLFWMGHISDFLLEYMYKNALATIVASKDEGFGLAITESAFYKTPIIARDIPIFREIGKDGVFYFPDDRPELIADSIKIWIELYKNGKIPTPENIKVMDWQTHTEILKSKII